MECYPHRERRVSRDIGSNRDDHRNRTHLDLHTDVNAARAEPRTPAATGRNGAGPHALGRVVHRQSAARVERDQERPLEGADPGPRFGIARRLGRSTLRADGRARWASPGDAQHAPRGSVTPRGVHRFMVLAIDRKTGKTIWERVAREQEPHEQSHVDNGTLGLELSDHRRRTRLRVLRVVRPLRLRHERQAPLGEGPRRQAHAERVRRRLDAGAARQHARHRLGPPGRTVVRRRARQARRQGTVARAAQGDRHLGHAPRARGQRTRAGRRPGHGTRAQLRPGDRRARLGERRVDDERDSVADLTATDCCFS